MICFARVIVLKKRQTGTWKWPTRQREMIKAFIAFAFDSEPMIVILRAEESKNRRIEEWFVLVFLTVLFPTVTVRFNFLSAPKGFFFCLALY